MDEVWKDIYFIENGIEYDYCGLYQISNFGNVRKIEKNGFYCFKGTKDKNGYLYVKFRKEKRRQFFIHRLVAHMFLTGYFDDAQVNHKDENPSNNHIDNLEWCTCKYNINYGTRNKKASEKLKGKPKSEEHKKNLSEANKGKHHTEETRAKQSETHKGEKNSRAKKIISVDPFTIRPIFIWQYKQQATEFYGIHRKTLDRYLKGKAKSGHEYNGFLWYYLDEYEQLTN